MLNFLKSPLGNLALMVLVISAVVVSVIKNSISGDEEDLDFSENSEEYSFKPEVYEREIPRFKAPRNSAPEETEAVEEIEEPNAEPEKPLTRPQQARQRHLPIGPMAKLQPKSPRLLQ